MTIRAITQQQSSQQSREQTSTTSSWLGRKVSNAIPQIARNLNKIAFPLITMAVLSSIPTGEAGPITYAACIAVCEASLFLAPGCRLLCAPALGPYCP